MTGLKRHQFQALLPLDPRTVYTAALYPRRDNSHQYLNAWHTARQEPHQLKVLISLSQIATPVRQAYRSRSQVYFARVGLVLKVVFLRYKPVPTSTKSAHPTIPDRDSGTTSIPESESGLPCNYYKIVHLI